MSLYTKDQLTRLYHAWGKPEAKIPTAKADTVLTFPPTADFRVVTVSRSPMKSTDRKALYEVTFEQPSETFEVRGYASQADFDAGNPDMLDDGICEKADALEVGREWLKEYPIVKVQSDSREFIEILHREP